MSQMATQYQHFIPQFILRKFSNFQQLRAEGETAKKARKYCKVSFLNLENGVFETRLACRTFGVQNMYEDNQISAAKFEVEEKLRILEQRAAKILDNIEHAYQRGDTFITLGRHDKDELRRFLFIMLYRNRTLEYRHEKSKKDYDADDRVLMMKYMEVKGFEHPKTVWLANIRAFLDIQLGYDTKRWMEEICQKAYPLDAQWFVGHLTTTFLSLCVPANSLDKFVLTQNAYSIFEGPSEEAQWTDWHVFAPVSPNLTIIMRKNMLQEYDVPVLENDRQNLLKSMLSTYFDDPIDAQSSLSDLPLERPQLCYDEPPSGNQQQFSNRDTFTFKFIRLCPDHLQRINSIFLEEALETTGVVFHSQESLRRALEAYFILDPIRFKQVSSNSELSKCGSAGLAFGREKNDWIRANRENYLKLLEEVAFPSWKLCQSKIFRSKHKVY